MPHTKLHSNATQREQAKLLKALSQCGGFVYPASAKAHIPVLRVLSWLRTDMEFNERVVEAIDAINKKPEPLTNEQSGVVRAHVRYLGAVEKAMESEGINDWTMMSWFKGNLSFQRAIIANYPIVAQKKMNLPMTPEM